MTRERLANRRPHSLQRFAHGEHVFEAGIGYAASSGLPREIFLNFAQIPGSKMKEGSDLQLLCNDIATMISIALQYGAPVEVLGAAVARLPNPMLDGKPVAEHAAPASLIGRALDVIAAEHARQLAAQVEALAS